MSRKASSHGATYCSLVLSVPSPFINMVCIMTWPLNHFRCSIIFLTSYEGCVGRSTRRIYSLSTVSSFRILLSTFISASRISCRPMKVELLSTLILASGHQRLRRRMVSSIIPAKCGLLVGSPLPAKVSTSGCCPSLCIAMS